MTHDEKLKLIESLDLEALARSFSWLPIDDARQIVVEEVRGVIADLMAGIKPQGQG